MNDAPVSPASERIEEIAAGAGRASRPGLPGLSRGYRRHVMVLLMVGCTLNFLDRGVINILAEPIKTVHLKNWRLGITTGFYFALFYSVLSVPIGREIKGGKAGAAWVTRTPDLRITNAPLYRPWS